MHKAGRRFEHAAYYKGAPLPTHLVGHLLESPLDADDSTLRERLRTDGYVFIRRVLDRTLVLDAREEVFSRLREVDEIASPPIAGIATGRSNRRQQEPDLIGFWRSVSEGAAIRRVSHGDDVRELMARILNEKARPQDYLWVRPRPVGWSTGFHFDHPYFARGNKNVHVAWIPLGNIPIHDGPIAIVENPGSFGDLINSMHKRDDEAAIGFNNADRIAFDGDWKQDIVLWLTAHTTRVLSADFCSGDILVFGMDSLHGALDNRSECRKVRLSCDVRLQPWSDPLDERFFGSDPEGTSGNGYGGHESSKPLTEL